MSDLLFRGKLSTSRPQPARSRCGGRVGCGRLRMPYKDPVKAKAYARRWRADHLEQVRAKSRVNMQRWRDAHREEARTTSTTRKRLWRAVNLEKSRAASRRWQAANRESQSVKHRAYYAAHREQLQGNGRAYYAEHMEERRAYSRAYRNAHLEAAQEKEERRRTRKLSATSTLTISQWKAILVAYKDRCAYCGVKPKSEKLTKDHVTPLAREGTHTADNVVPACRSCNAHKHAGPPPIIPALRLLI